MFGGRLHALSCLLIFGAQNWLPHYVLRTDDVATKCDVRIGYVLLCHGVADG